jgi:hypothetical protein
MTAPLIVCAARGDTAAVERLLREGAEPNCTDQHGRTALHAAVEHAHADTAACLLIYGSDPEIADGEGMYPLSLSFTTMQTLHAIRQHHRRFPARSLRDSAAASTSVEAWASGLERRGIIKLTGLIDADMLAGLRSEFAAFVGNLEAKLYRGEGRYRHYDEEEHLWVKDRALVSNNAFKYSRQLARLCCRRSLIDLSARYLGRRAFVSRGVAMRYLPSPPSDHDMFGWHHDMEDKRLKVMILLTDVGADDQAMSYVVGSHRLFHPYGMFFENACSLDYCRAQLNEVDVFHAVGKAGDVFVFDSNGAHRGNRRESARMRDIFLVEYASEKADVWGGDFAPDAFAGVRVDGPHPFEHMLSVE